MPTTPPTLCLHDSGSACVLLLRQLPAFWRAVGASSAARNIATGFEREMVGGQLV